MSERRVATPPRGLGGDPRGASLEGAHPTARADLDRYAGQDVALRVARLEGQLVLAATLAGAATPAYFILLEWEAGRVTSIRDFRCVPYIAEEAALEPVEP